MNTQKIQSMAASIYRREFEKSQYRTLSNNETQKPEKKTNHPNEREFEDELARALENFNPQGMSS